MSNLPFDFFGPPIFLPGTAHRKHKRPAGAGQSRSRDAGGRQASQKRQIEASNHGFAVDRLASPVVNRHIRDKLRRHSVREQLLR
jgi:hypothetical protein